MNITFVFNNTDWITIDEKIKEICDFYSPIMTIIPTVIKTSFKNIPFQSVSTINGVANTVGTASTVRTDWYSQNITALAPLADIIVFYLSSDDCAAYPFTPAGIMQGKINNVVQCCVFKMKENDYAYIFDQSTNTEVDEGNCFVLFAEHEISHALYMLQGKNDNTHIYFYTGRQTKILDELHPYPSTRTKIEALLNYCIQLLGLYKQLQIMQNESTTNPIPPVTPIFLWDTPENCRHSVRVKCDMAGLALYDKEVITACIKKESNFNPKAIGQPNSNGTVDYGICQFNNGHNAHGVPLWIGQGAYFASTDEVLNNPGKCVDEMIAQYKLGHIGWWSSYSTGAYKQFMP